jgi:hypothetical protein
MGRRKKQFTPLPYRAVDDSLIPTEEEERDIFYIWSPLSLGMDGEVTTEDITKWLEKNKIRRKKDVFNALYEYFMPEQTQRYLNKIKREKQKKHDDFCYYFVLCFNAKHAAILAGYSPHSARWTGPALLKRRDIRIRIAEMREELWD